MKQLIDIKLLKESTQLLFSYVPEKAEEEINIFLQYIFFKYNVVINNENSKKKKTKFRIDDILPKKITEFRPLNKNEIYER